MSRKVGLFGGTFDPVHSAHVALARAALHALRLDQVRWLPTGQPWQKAHHISAAEHRVAMVQLAIADEPRFVLDRIEVDRAGPSYTLDTVRALEAADTARHGKTEWVFIIGQDQYAALHTWHDWQQLLGLVTLAVANRPGQPGQPAEPLSADRAVLAFAHRAVPLPMLDISATDIRERAAAGRDISQLVPPAVARYIDSHRLYQAQPRS